MVSRGGQADAWMPGMVSGLLADPTMNEHRQAKHGDDGHNDAQTYQDGWKVTGAHGGLSYSSASERRAGPTLRASVMAMNTADARHQAHTALMTKSSR